MDTISERVRGLVARLDVSQGEFAQQIGLDNPKLSKSLSGARRFSSLDLARIADVCDVSVDWLLTGVEVPLALAARAEAGAESEQAIAAAYRLGNARSDIERLGYPQPWRALTGNVPAGTLIEQGAALASAAEGRFQEHGLDATGADLAGAIETAFGVDVAICDLGPQFDGLCLNGGGAKIILASQGALPWRQRFTIAHELGHLLSGDDQGLHQDRDILAASRSRDHSEMRANAFAAALLMPAEVLRAAVGSAGLGLEDFARLGSSLRVSPSALAFRLQSFRLIDAGTTARFRRESAKSLASAAGLDAEFASEVAVAGRGRPPGLLAKDTYAAYLAGDASLRPYANVLQVDVEELLSQLEAPGGSEGGPA